MKLYINGVSYGTQNRTPNANCRSGTGQAIRFFDSTNSTDTGFPAVIDEVAIYNVALSAAQVSANYTTGATPFFSLVASASATASLSARAPTQVPLAGSAAVASGTLILAGARIPLNNSTAAASGSLSVAIPTFQPLTLSASASASGSLSLIAPIRQLFTLSSSAVASGSLSLRPFLRLVASAAASGALSIGYGQFVQAQHAQALVAGTTVVANFNSPVVVGNMIIVGVSWSRASTIASVTDNKGNTYRAIPSALTDDGANYKSQLYYAIATTGGSPFAITATTDTSTTNRQVIIAEYNSLAAPESATSNAGIGTAVSADITTLTPNALIISYVRGTNNVTPGPESVLRDTFSQQILQERAQAVAGSVTVTAVHGSSTFAWGMVGAAFRLTTTVGTPLTAIRLFQERRLSHYKFELARSSDMSRIGELVQARGRSLQLALNKAGAFSCTLPLDDELTDYVGEVETCIVISRDGETIWSGPVWGLTETISASTASLQINAVGWQQILDKRVVRPNWNQGQPITYVDTDAGAIALDLLTRSNLDAIGVGSPQFIFPGTAEITQPRTRTYQPFSSILAALNELTDIESGFDMSVDPDTRELNIYTKIGETKDVVFELPGSVSSVNRTTDSGRIINFITAYSSGGSWSESDIESVSRLGLFEEAQSLSDVLNVNILAAFAAGEILVRSRPLRIITFVPMPESIEQPYWPRVFRDFNIGDTVMLSAHHGRVQFDRQLLRAFTMTVNFPETGGAAVSSFQGMMA